MTDDLNNKLQTCIRNRRSELVEVLHRYEFDAPTKFNISEENKEDLKRFELDIEIIPLVILGEKAYRYRVVTRKEKIRHLITESIGISAIVLFCIIVLTIPIILYLKTRGIIQ